MESNSLWPCLVPVNLPYAEIVRGIFSASINDSAHCWIFPLVQFCHTLRIDGRKLQAHTRCVPKQMSTLIYKLKYRPIRLGWCVRDGDKASLIKAFRLSHCLWGGRFNPIIVVDNESFARHLVELFHVDALFPIGDDEHCRSFPKIFKHLPWPTFHGDLFEDCGIQKESIFLDIYHPVRLFYEEFVKDKSAPIRNTTLYSWSDEDPCAGLFEAMFGNYPALVKAGLDYRQFVSKYTASKEREIKTNGTLEKSDLYAMTPNVLTAFELKPELGTGNYEPGLFVGEVDSFSHLVEFWNLRAADIELLFFDPRFRERFDPMVEELKQSVRSRPPNREWGTAHLQLWLKKKLNDEELKRFNSPLDICEAIDATCTDRIWRSLRVNPPVMYLSEGETIAQMSEGVREPIVTLQLGNKPGFNERPYNHQHLVVTLKPTVNLSLDDRFVFTVPNVPELNEYFGRKHHLDWNEVRAEKEGLGIVTNLGTDHIPLWGMERYSLAKKLFQTFGIATDVGQPGLICEQLIRQMGGLQGCRVFKIAGVRKLIEQFDPTEEFTRSDAMRLIANVDSEGRPNFTAYEHLYLEPRDKDSLKPEDAFIYLLKRGVFRVGLKLKCTGCQLEFWRGLDDIKTEIACEYCGRAFNVAPQLKGEKWAYRPSGLFGRDDHQEGGVPVALTLQQLDTVLHGQSIFWLPAMNFEPLTAPIERCETDFVVLHQTAQGRVELVIGECKTNQEVTEDDVRHLSKVADAFPSNRFDVFVAFAKAGTAFTPEEIRRCRSANSRTHQRTIMLSARELEPYFVYERAEKEFSIHGHVASLEGMVKATNDIYFEPKLKNRPSTP